MAIPTTITDGLRDVKVTSSGELVTSSLAYDETQYFELDSAVDSFSFFPPKVGKQFVITGFTAVSDKNITADAIVEIFEANAADSTTALKTLPKFAMTKNAVVSPTPLRILVTEGVWVNAKTDDASIHLTMFGYYINAID
jgi:hypothetical protein